MEGDGSVPADRPSGDALPFPTIGRTFAALGIFVVGMVGGLPFIVLEDRVSVGVWLFLMTVPGGTLGLYGALRITGWPLRRLPRDCVLPRGSLAGLFVSAIGCVFVTALLLAIGRRFVPMEGPDDLMRQVAAIDRPFELALVAYMIAIHGPIMEELLVRGILLRGFAANWGRAAGVAMSAFVFAVLHMNLAQGALGIVTGTVFALAVLRTGSLGPGIFMHIVINATALAGVVSAGVAGPDEAEAMPLWLALVLGVIGIELVRFGFRALPDDPRRLAALWNLPPRDPR